MSYLLNICETTLNDNNIENTARLVVGLDNLELKIRTDQETVMKCETSIRDKFLVDLQNKKRDLEAKMKDTTKKLKNKSLSMASKILSIEQKLQGIAKKTNSFDIKSREINYIDNSIESMGEYLNTAEKDLEDIKFLTGGQSDSYVKKDDKVDIVDDRMQRSLSDISKPAILSFAERLRSSLRILEDTILEAENDVIEMRNSLGYRLM